MINKILRALLIPLICVSLIVFPAMAITYLNVIPASVTITVGVSDVVVYSDLDLTQELTSIDIPSLERNQAWVGDAYVRNEGSSEVTIAFTTEGNTAFGMIMFAPVDPIMLQPMESSPVQISIYALPTAMPGNYNFSIIIYDFNS